MRLGTQTSNYVGLLELLSQGDIHTFFINCLDCETLEVLSSPFLPFPILRGIRSQRLQLLSLDLIISIFIGRDVVQSSK